MTKTQRPFVSIVVANWEGAHFLPRCLSSLQIAARGARLSFEIIVVDDASTDESVPVIRERFPAIRLITNSRNEGFARTVNRGADAARGRVLVLANNDIVVREDFIANLARWYLPGAPPISGLSGRLFGVSARTVGWYDGRPNQLCMGAVWKGGRITPAYDEPARPAPCLFVQAGAAAYDARLYRRLGGLSMLYEPGYWEDYDLSWRACKRGWSCLYDPDAFALHVGGGSMTRRFGARGVALMKARNHLLFEAVNLTSPGLMAEWSARVALGLGRDVGGRCRDRLYTDAVAGMIRRLPRALAARVATGRTLSDEQLLRPFRHFTPAF